MSEYIWGGERLRGGKMDVDLIMKVAGVGMIVAVVCQILGKVGREEQATLVSITGIVIILVIIIERVGEMLETVRRIFGL
jgi:stage III sporulation protein AC